MKRRNFLSKTIKSSIALSTIGLISCKNNSKSLLPFKKINSDFSHNLFKLSLAQWSIHRLIEDEIISPYEFAKFAKNWGFSGLEYVSDLYKINEASNKLSAIKKFVSKSIEQSDQYNLENLLIMIDEEGDLSVESKNERDEAIVNHYKWIDAAAQMGCHSVRINLFGVNDPIAWAEYSKESLIALSEYSSKLNINILVENHGYLSSNSALLMEVLNDVNLPNCGTLPDFGNFCLGRVGGDRWDTECLEEYDKYKGVNELLPMAMAVSAKSYNFDSNGQETTIDFSKMMQMVKDSGYKGYIGVEYEGDILSEQDGTLATRKLLIDTIKNLS